MTILLTTHYLDEAERLCDRVGIMHAGRIVALDTPAAPARRRSATRWSSCALDTERDARSARRACGPTGIAGDDAFAVGTTITIPVHDRPASAACSAVAGLGLAATRP